MITPNVVRRFLAVVFACALGAAASSAGAQQKLYFSPVSKIVIEGKSNIHAWTCATSTFDAAVDAPKLPPAETGSKLTDLTITIPIRSLDCGHGDMNKNLQKTMHADKNPAVKFRMTSYESAKKGDSYDAIVHGVLTINAIDKPILLRASVTPNAAGGASIVGSAPVKTTDFGVAPVKVMLGTLRTSPDVTITFRLTAIPRQ